MGAVVGIVAGADRPAGSAGRAGQRRLSRHAELGRPQAGPLRGEPALFVKERRGVAVGTTAVAALGLLLTLGGSVPVDVLGAVLAAGGGLAAKRALDGTRDRFRGGA